MTSPSLDEVALLCAKGLSVQQAQSDIKFTQTHHAILVERARHEVKKHGPGILHAFPRKTIEAALGTSKPALKLKIFNEHVLGDFTPLFKMLDMGYSADIISQIRQDKDHLFCEVSTCPSASVSTISQLSL